MKVIWLFLFVSSITGYNLVYIGTDQKMFSTLLEFTFNISATSTLLSVKTAQNFFSQKYEDLSLIIDDTKTEISTSLLASFATVNEIPLYVIESGQNTKWVHYARPSNQCTFQSMTTVLKFFNFTEIGITTSLELSNQRLADTLEKYYPSKFSKVSTAANYSKTELAQLFARVFKIAGIQNYVFFSHFSLCSLYSQAFKSAFLEKEGTIAVYLDECIYQVTTNGSFILSSSVSLKSSSYYDYIVKQSSYIFTLLSRSGLSNYQISNEMNKNTTGCRYSLINIQNSQKVVVGTLLNGVLTLNSSLIYFGGKNQSTIFIRPIITISANTGEENPPPNAPTSLNKYYHRGTYYGVAKVNKERIHFPNYDLFLYDKVNCGVAIFDANYSKNCFLKEISHMGIAYITTLQINTNVLSQFSSLKIDLPCIGGASIQEQLSNKTKYPTYTRIVSPSIYFMNSWTNLIGIFGWKNIILFYSNNSLGLTLYPVLLSNSQLKGYNILNNETERMVGVMEDNSTRHVYYDAIKRALATGCNILFVIMNDPTAYYFLESLYDTGVRRGDLTIILNGIAAIDSLTASGANTTKRAELLHGSFAVHNAGWVGPYGQKVKQDYLNTVENNTLARSFYIDAVLTAANTVDFLMMQGKFYENSTEFMIAQRNLRMEGCTGIISFDKASNDRNLYYFNVYNFYQDIDGKWTGDEVGLISPLSNVYYTYLKDPVWSSGEIPIDMKRNYSNCPFRENQIKSSVKGNSIKIGVSIGLLILASLLTIYLLTQISYSHLEMLAVKCYATVQDYMTLIFIFIEALQVIAIGPKFMSFNSLLSGISEYMSLNLSNSVDFKDNLFWVIFYSILCLCYFWIFILLLSASKIFGRCSGIFYRINAFKDFSIPILSNYLFIPTLIVILSILACDYAIGPDLSDSYLNYDCNQRCWAEDYFKKMIPAALLIVLYIPNAILYRTLWQESNTKINVRSRSIYLVIKNITFIFLIIIGKTIKDDYPLAHAFVFLSVLLLFMLYIIYIKNPFNFDRANIWTKVLFSCVIWNTIVCIGDIFQSNLYVLWLVLQLSGWSVIFIVGIGIIRKMPPSLIVTPKGRSIVELLRFAFGIEQLQPVYQDSEASLKDIN